MAPRGWSSRDADPLAEPRSGPPARFVAMLIAELPRLRRYATAWLGNAADADDLVQDCMERAIERHATLRRPDRLGSWLLAILHNLHVSGIRSGRRHGEPVDVQSLADELLPSVPAVDAGQLRDFARAMGQLSPEHRQILLLVALEGLSYREIAEVLELPLGTVMSRLARGRERLRGLLEGGQDVSVRSVR